MAREGLERRQTPGPVRTFFHGVNVATREVSSAQVKQAVGVTSGVAGIGGLFTMIVGSPDAWQWNGPTDTGVAIMGTVVGGWALYGASRAVKATGRHFTAKGAAAYRAQSPDGIS